MTGARSSVWLVGAAAMLAVEPAGAHHSFATHYLMDRSMEITGIVTEASLRNPHSFFTLEVATDDGVVEWEVEAHAVPLFTNSTATPTSRPAPR